MRHIIFAIFILLPMRLCASEIELAHAILKEIGKSVHTNAEIIQLSDQKQQIVSRLGGHIEKYFVTAGDRVSKGDAVASIASIKLSKMSADYLASAKQLKAAKSALDTARVLYKKGMGSKNELNERILSLQELKAKRNTLESQLKSIGIDTKKLNTPTDSFKLYAHAQGEVSEILAPLHANVNAQTPIITIVQSSRYDAIAYLNISDALKVDPSAKATLLFADKYYSASFVQLMNAVDSETQRAKIRFRVDENSSTRLLVGAYVQMDLTLSPFSREIVIKKSALTLLNGEWIVFVKKLLHENERHADHNTEEHHDEHADEKETEDHDHLHEEARAFPYEPRVVEIMDYFGDEVAVKGLKENETYVVRGVYMVKSMLLKSSLGEHGH